MHLTAFDIGDFLQGAFNFNDDDFKISFLNTSNGFTSPSWEGYDTEELNVTAFPASP